MLKVIVAATLIVFLAGTSRGDESPASPKSPPSQMGTASVDADGFVLVERTVERLVTEPRTELVASPGGGFHVETSVRTFGKSVSETTRLAPNTVQAMDKAGKRINPKDLASLLKNNPTVLICTEGQTVDPAYLKEAREGTIVLILPKSDPGVVPPKPEAAVNPPRPETPAVHPTTAPAGAAVTNSLGMKLVPIPAGEFVMGSAGHVRDEKQHVVKLSRPFLMQSTHVTQAQWQAIMNKNPSRFKGDDLPVDTVSWDDAVEFCRLLSAKEGKKYRLPTEAEWEFACRAGTTSDFGDVAALDEAAWYTGNSGHKSHPVGQKKANAWGLYDMHGNVNQWCSDAYGLYDGDATDPQGATGDTKVFRGGYSDDNEGNCAAGHRNKNRAAYKAFFIGFRVCRDN